MFLYHMIIFCLAVGLPKCYPVYSPDWPTYYDIRSTQPLQGPFACSESHSLLLTASVNRMLIIHSAPDPVSNKDLLMYKDNNYRETDGFKRVNLHIAATNESIYIAGNGWNITENENQVGGPVLGMRINIMCMKDEFIIYIGQFKSSTQRNMDRFVTENLYGSIQGNHNNFYVMGGHPELKTIVDEQGFSTFQNLKFNSPLGSIAAGSNNGWVKIRLYVRGSNSGDFDINFMQGIDIGLLISLRFTEYRFVMNCRIDGAWGTRKSFEMFFNNPPWANSLVIFFENSEVKVYGDNVNHLIGTYTMPSTTLMNRLELFRNNVEGPAIDQPVDVIGFDQGWNE